MTRSRILVSFLSTLLVASAALAQPSRPLSPPGSANTQVGGKWTVDKDGERTYTGGKWIDVTYSRPSLRGRADLLCKGADYGKQVICDAPIWRAGANLTTRIKTEVPLEIGGKRLEPGEYSLFVDLKEPAWTLVISNQPAQAKFDPNEKKATVGAYNYDPKFDLVRVPMQMAKPAFSVDQFTIAFVDVTDQGGKLAMVWEKTGGVVPFKVVS